MSHIPEVTIVGAGMIVHDQLLPALYQLQRLGRIGEITVCDARRSAVEGLAKAQPQPQVRLLPARRRAQREL